MTQSGASRRLARLTTAVAMAWSLPGAASGPQRVAFEERLVNLEVGTEVMRRSTVNPVVREPPADVSREVWYGQALYRTGPDETEASYATFAVQYRAGAAERVWFDANHDLDFTNDPGVTLYEYPRPRGARSFVTDLSWGTRDGTRKRPVTRKLRFVIDPPPLGDPPSFRIQCVMGRLGEVRVGGRPHLAVLMDGNSDGLYTVAFGDGVFVDLNDDRYFEVDLMSAEFGPFSIPFEMGGRRYRARPLDSDGVDIEIDDLGAAISGPFAEVGKPAPNFAFPGPGNAAKHLEDLRGRWVVIQFWASWCSACKVEAPALRDLYQRLHPRELEIVGVSYDDDVAEMQAFRDAEGQTWPTTFSGRRFWEDPVGRLYQARGAGLMVLVRPDGVLDGSFTDVASIERRIGELRAAAGGK